MPARGIGKGEQGYYSLDVSLLEALPHPEKPVEWSLTFDVLHPVFALEDAPYTVTEGRRRRFLHVEHRHGGLPERLSRGGVF